jgi:hypothetical protein
MAKRTWTDVPTDRSCQGGYRLGERGASASACRSLAASLGLWVALGGGGCSEGTIGSPGDGLAAVVIEDIRPSVILPGSAVVVQGRDFVDADRANTQAELTTGGLLKADGASGLLSSRVPGEATSSTRVQVPVNQDFSRAARWRIRVPRRPEGGHRHRWQRPSSGGRRGGDEGGDPGLFSAPGGLCPYERRRGDRGAASGGVRSQPGLFWLSDLPWGAKAGSIRGHHEAAEPPCLRRGDGEHHRPSAGRRPPAGGSVGERSEREPGRLCHLLWLRLRGRLGGRDHAPANRQRHLHPHRWLGDAAHRRHAGARARVPRSASVRGL